jgi:hypothetical protein
MSETNGNMTLWNSVSKTEDKYKKAVNYGKRSFTAINAQSQIKKATEIWGEYGRRWGVKGCKYEYLRDANNNIVELTLEAIFYYPFENNTCEFEISTDIKYVAGSDCRKKILTDLTTKALSKLGFNADVFMNDFSDNKYQNPPRVNKETAKVKMNDTQFMKLLKRIEKGEKELIEKARQTFDLTPAQIHELNNEENATNNATGK